MTSKQNKLYEFLFLAILVLSINCSSFGYIIHLPDYSASTFAFANGQGDGLAVDASSNVYAPNPDISQIQRFSPSGIPQTWSTARGDSLAVCSDGSAFLATRGLGHSILKIKTDGSFSELVPASSELEWTYLTLDLSGHLYATVWGLSKIYSVDATNGIYFPIFTGGNIYYRDMVFGPDGRLYVLGTEGSNHGLFRLDENVLTKVIALPHGGLGLTVDPFGNFYTATSYGSNPEFDEVWIMNPSTGNASLLISGLNAPAGIAYDPFTAKLFVRDQGPYQGPYQILAVQTPNPPIPEPATMLLVGLGGMLIRQRAKGKR